MNNQPAVVVGQHNVPPPPHPLSVVLGAVAYNTVVVALGNRQYNANHVWQEVQRLVNTPQTLQKIRALVPEFVQSSGMRTELTQAFDVAVHVLANWTLVNIQQLLPFSREGVNGQGPQPNDWGRIAGQLTAGQATAHNAAQFVRCPGWDTIELVALAHSFNGNQRNMTAVQWAAIACRLQGGNRTTATALCFISLPSPPWTPGLKALLALAYQTAAHDLTATEYVAIAAALTGLRATDTNVKRFAAMTNYAAAERAALAASFEADQAGLPSDNWLLIADPLTAINATAANAEVFVRLVAWTRQERRLLAIAFQANPHGMSAAEWGALATALGPAHALTSKCTAFAGIPLWAAAEKTLLAATFQANGWGMDVLNWAATAATLTGARATAATAAVFASLAGWQAPQRVLLSAAYEANQQGMSPAEWDALARALTDGQATRDNAVAFASLAAWPNAQKIALAQAFNQHQQGMTAQQWAAVAAALNGVHRTAPIALNFINLPQWTAAERVVLAASFIVNQRHRTAAEWAALAVNLTAGRATTATATALLDIAGWNAGFEAALAQEFNTNQRGATAAAWAATATTYGGPPRVLRTLRHMAYLARGWPPTVNLNGVNFGLKALASAGPGLVYENGHYPHVTIHDLSLNDSPHQWHANAADYQVVLGGGPPNTYPHVGTQYQPFVGIGGNPAVPTAIAAALATAFWQAF
ncbi:hypothetical protein LPN04_28000 [Rugamonas sp. A1-17]|nr:hypothetical protein [Rugamonas sp. A1-17]